MTPPAPPQGACCRGRRDGPGGTERKPKRRLEREGPGSERRERVRRTRAPGRKRARLSRAPDTDTPPRERERERGCEAAPAAETQPLASDASCSEQEDSEDEDAVCPAASCLQPEGDEVSGPWAAPPPPPLSADSP